jgi:hypothetical protein
MLTATLTFFGALAATLLVYATYSFNQGTGACCTGTACQPRNKAQCDLLQGSFLADTSCAAAPCTLPPTPGPTPAPPAIDACDLRFLLLEPAPLRGFCVGGTDSSVSYQVEFKNQLPDNSNCPKPAANITLTPLCSGTPCKDIPGAITKVTTPNFSDLTCGEFNDDILCPDIIFTDEDDLSSSSQKFDLADGFQNNVTMLVTVLFETGFSYTRFNFGTTGSVCK